MWFSRWSRKSSAASENPNVSICRRSGSTSASTTLSTPSVLEAVGDGVNVREQFLGVVVAAGANVPDAVDSLAHQGQFLAVGFLGVAFGRTLGDGGELLPVGIEARIELTTRLHAVAVLAQHAGEALQFVAVAFQHDLALAVERLGRDFRRYVRVAVPVAPGPRPEGEQFRHVHVELRSNGAVEFVVHVAHDVEEDVFEVPEDVSSLVGHLRTAFPDLSRLPETGHFALQLTFQFVLFLVGQHAFVEF